MNMILKSLAIMAVLLTGIQPVFAVNSPLSQEISISQPIQKNSIPQLKSVIIPTFISGISVGLLSLPGCCIYTCDDFLKSLRESNDENHSRAVIVAIATGIFTAIGIGSGIIAYKNSKNVLDTSKNMRQEETKVSQIKLPVIHQVQN